jgi:Mannosyltransferase (PIG-V)
MSFETAEPAIAEHPSEHALQGVADARGDAPSAAEPAVGPGVPADMHVGARADLQVPAREAAGEAAKAAQVGVKVYVKTRCPPRARGASRFSTVPTPPRSVRLAAARARLGAERTAALRDVWLSVWSSRLLVWLAGSGAVAVLGFGPVRHAFNPPGVTRGFGWLGDVLAAPVARWDAAWYLVIAHYGYRPEFGAFTAPRDAFFPLYPLGLRALSDIGLAPVIAGVAFSIGAFMAALYGLHRLTTLEVARLRRPPLDSRRVARLAALLTAFAPMAFYFSAIYSESLYLALSVGLFLCARRGRWGTAAVLGALASATRSTGVVLIVPLLLLYLYGPRDDREPERPPVGRSDALVVGRSLVHRSRLALAELIDMLRPRYRLRRDALWLALVPLGLALYMAHLALAGGDPLAPFHAEAVWKRHFAGPYGGIWDGTKAAFAGLRQLLSFQREHNYYPVAGGSLFIDAGHNVLLFAFLLLAIPMLVGVLRLLPLAYGAYLLTALALPMSYPVAPQPLMSLPRFLLVLFPLNMWLAVTLASRPRVLTRFVLVLSGLAMAFFVGEFSTWHWVA